MLQTQFAIVRGPARFFDHEMLKNIRIACIILHNMIVEDERHLYLGADDFVYDQLDESLYERVSHTANQQLTNFIEHHHHIRDRVTILSCNQISSSIYGKYIANRNFKFHIMLCYSSFARGSILISFVSQVLFFHLLPM